MQINWVIDLLQYWHLEIQFNPLEISKGQCGVFIPTVIHKLRSSQLEKNASKKSTVYVPFDGDLSILLCVKRTLGLVRFAQLPSVYFRSCIIRQWLWFFGGGWFPDTMNWSRLSSSKDGELAGRPGGGCSTWRTDVWKCFLKTCLAAQCLDPLHIPKHFKHTCFPPAVSLKYLCVFRQGTGSIWTAGTWYQHPVPNTNSLKHVSIETTSNDIIHM